MNEPRPQDATQQQQRLGERLVAAGLISHDQLNVALHEKKRSTKLLGTILVELGFLEDQALAAILAEQTGLRRVNLQGMILDPALAALLPKTVAQRCQAVAVTEMADAYHLAMVDPYDVLALDEIRRHLPKGKELHLLVATAAEVSAAIERLYGLEQSIAAILQELETGQFDLASLNTTQGQYRHPIVRLLDWFLLDAVKQDASDLHFEPEANFIRVRYRLDGVLTPVQSLHRDHWQTLSHRLKVVAGMNIADQRNVQDGRFTLQLAGSEVDFRASLLPTVHGENIVLRVLNHRRSLLPLEALGFSGEALTLLRKLIKRPEGIVVITGPTGCGKTTTLYSLLQEISTPEVNIMTLEDPVEYRLPLIRQTQVREAGGLGFAEGVRAILRQDPDIVFIGEIRDHDTAQMALRAAMTGHQVYSTLHTNDALGAVPRLVDLGLNPQVLAGNVIAALAQRLVRKLCTHCRAPRAATEDEAAIMGLSGRTPTVYAAKGCEACRHTGYRGRVAVLEILRHTPEMDELVLAGASHAARLKCAREQGFVRMAEDGVAKILRGEIDLTELIRAVDVTDRL